MGDTLKIILIFALTMSVNLFTGIMRKVYSDKTIDTSFWQFFYVMLTGAMCVVVFLCWGGLGETSGYTWIMGGVYGLAVAFQSFTYMGAVANGSFAISTLIISLGALLPALSGAIFWDEKLSIANIVGLGLMVVAIVLSAGKNKEGRKAGKKWLAYIVPSFVLAVAIGVIQKFHQMTEHKGELNCFLVSCFGVSVLCMLAACGVVAMKKKKEGVSIKEMITNPPFGKIWFLIVAAVGICVAVNNKINLYLSGIVSSMVFFPTINGGAMVLTTISSLVIFKEKLSVRMWLSVFFGIVAIVLVCMPGQS